MKKRIIFIVLLPIFLVHWGALLSGQTRRALLVGINNYEPKVLPKASCRKQWWNLCGCINDVEAMEAILESRHFGFKSGNIHVLKNEEATRERILTDFKKYLIDGTSSGDICVFYYSGHGSRVKNSMSDEPDKMDETLVPVDWYRGVRDIRDKELKKLYNRVLDKNAHLTVIVDACHSGSISRGIPVRLRYRSLPPDLCDVAEPPDRKKSPAERGALIFSAAQDFQAAVETKDENNHCHGLFTWALLKVLRNIPAHESSENVLLKIKAIMKSEGKFQEPNLEGQPGKTRKSILEVQTEGAAGPLRAAVSMVRRQLVELEGGLALGIREGCEFKKIPGEHESEAVRVRVTAVHGLSRCTARIIEGDIKKINIGDLFELDKWVAAREARLRVFIPASDYSFKRLTRIAVRIAVIRESKRIVWVEDPLVRPSAASEFATGGQGALLKNRPLDRETSAKTFINPLRGVTHIISWHQSYWILQSFANGDHRIVKLGRNPGNDMILTEILKNHTSQNIKPRVFLQLPLSVELERTVRTDLEDYKHSIEVSSSQEGIHYILVGRCINQKLLPGSRGRFSRKEPPGRRRQDIQYAWVLPNMTQEGKQGFPLPVRTGWLPVEESETRFQELAEELTDNMLHLVRIRAWFQLSSPPDNGRFPYQLALKNAETGSIAATGPLLEGEIYGLTLRADEARLKTLERIERRYVYVFSIDSFGKGTLLFPRQIFRNTENCFPSKKGDHEDAELNQKFLQGGPAGAVFSKRGGRPQPIHGQPDGVLSGASSQKFAEKTKIQEVLAPGRRRQETEIELGSKELFVVGEPFGMDTFILLTTTDAISHPGVLDFSGVRKRELTGEFSPLEELLYDLSSVSRRQRGRPMSINWSIQRLSILSKPK